MKALSPVIHKVLQYTQIFSHPLTVQSHQGIGSITVILLPVQEYGRIIGKTHKMIGMSSGTRSIDPIAVIHGSMRILRKTLF